MKAQNRWAIYLDIEGTSKIYEDHSAQFHASFDQLLGAIYAIGTKVFPEPPLRLFAHQVGGDGIVIVSDFDEPGPERFVSIAVILMQVLLVHGLVGKAGISSGTYSDIRGCVPSLREVPKAGDSSYCLGAGLLTTLNVMGTALINAHRLTGRLAPRGCVLVVDPMLMLKKPQGVVFSDFGGPVVVDWVHTKTAVMELIIQKAALNLPPSTELEKRLARIHHNFFSGPDNFGRFRQNAR